MWYYAKDKKKIGPISDAALLKLYKEGIVENSTLVWSNSLNSRNWSKFDSTDFFAKLTHPPTSQSLKNLKKGTILLRAFLISTFVIFGIKLIYTWNSHAHYIDTISDSDATSTLLNKIVSTENSLILTLISQIIFLMILICLFMAFRWLYASTYCARVSDKNFTESPSLSAWSIFIPFVNFILPCKITWKLLKSSLQAVHKKCGALHVTLIFLCEIFWILGVVMIFIQKFGFTRSGNLDMVTSIHILSAYTDFVAMTTILLFVFLISYIFSLQNSYLSNPKNIRH